jgi:glycopeptide antibiotics resistance protein
MMQFLKSLLLCNMLAVPCWLLFRVVQNKQNERSKLSLSSKRELFLLLVVIYIVSIASITVIPLPEFRKDELSTPHINLIPLATIVGGIIGIFKDVHHQLVLINVSENFFGNILMFIPFGILIPILNTKYDDLKKIFWTALLCSAIIETIQFLSMSFNIYRYVDIDDVILNTTGAVIGYALYKRHFKPGYVTAVIK